MKAVLFDFDGVVVNTEFQYDVFFNDLAERYGLEIDDFAAKIKGVTIPDMMKLFFSGYTQEEKDNIVKETAQFEAGMDFILIPGVADFIASVKSRNIKTALVTSSPSAKMKIALKKLHMENTFDTLITADQVTKGKPDPMCYLLAAKNLNVLPAECVVFEDAITGINAGKSAGARVVALSTSFPVDVLKQYVTDIIPDFTAVRVTTAGTLELN